MRALSQLEYVWRRQANDKAVIEETVSREEPENVDSVLPHPQNNKNTSIDQRFHMNSASSHALISESTGTQERKQCNVALSF